MSKWDEDLDEDFQEEDLLDLSGIEIELDEEDLGFPYDEGLLDTQDEEEEPW